MDILRMNDTCFFFTISIAIQLEVRVACGIGEDIKSAIF